MTKWLCVFVFFALRGVSVDAPSVAQRGALNNSWRRKGCCFCRLVELGKLTLLLWYLLSCFADGGRGRL